MFGKKSVSELISQFVGESEEKVSNSLGELQSFDVAILVCELGMLPQLLTKMDISSVKKILDQFYDTVSIATKMSNGDLQNMFQGKCYCVFGAPQKLENPLESAEKAATSIASLWQNAITNESIPIQIAVESGVIHCGIFGTAGRRGYEGLGDAYARAEHKLRGLNQDRAAGTID